MNIQLIRTQIEAFLDDHIDVEKFKIGKTSNLATREDDYQENGYHKVIKICSGEAKEISDAEIALTRYFRDDSKYKERCDNRRDGGGSSDATILYIALRINDISIQHLNEFEVYEQYFSCINN